MATDNPSARHGVFVSHANPEDNEFATWLTLRLSQLGYRVWCDVARLHGGEDFWKNIEDQIRNHAAKFLFVLSRASNTKQGALNELRVASITAAQPGLHDFVVPLKIDDIPFGDMNIELARLNAVVFDPNWAAGLGSLLTKLEEDGVPRSGDSSASVVAAWWRRHRPAGEGVIAEPERHVSNWLAIEPLPDKLFFHEIVRSGSGPSLPQEKLPVPVAPHNNFLVSLLEADAVATGLPGAYRIQRSIPVSFGDFAGQELTVANIDRRERRVLVSNLLRQSWEQFMPGKKVRRHGLSDDRTCFFLDHLEGVTDRMPFRRDDGTDGHRGLTGYKTVGAPSPDSKRKRYWHFALSAKPMIHPLVGLVLYPHVLFSDDGKTIWESQERLHAARRSQCRWWFNAEWRNRILAFLRYLADDGDVLSLPGRESGLRVPTQLVAFQSPVAYQLAVETVSPYEPGDMEDDVDDENEIEDDVTETEEEPSA